MIRIPVTGVALHDFGLLALVFIAGLLIAVKGGRALGWVVVAVAVVWAVRLAQVLIRT